MVSPVSVEEAAERLWIGRSLMYEPISSGQVTLIHVRRLRKITPEAINAYVPMPTAASVIDQTRWLERLSWLELEPGRRPVSECSPGGSYGRRSSGTAKRLRRSQLSFGLWVQNRSS